MEAAAAAAAMRRNSGSKKGDVPGGPPRPLLAKNDANGFADADVVAANDDDDDDDRPVVGPLGPGKNGLKRPAIDGFEKNETGLRACGDFWLSNMD